MGLGFTPADGRDDPGQPLSEIPRAAPHVEHAVARSRPAEFGETVVDRGAPSEEERVDERVIPSAVFERDARRVRAAAGRIVAMDLSSLFVSTVSVSMSSVQTFGELHNPSYLVMTKNESKLSRDSVIRQVSASMGP
jgi:hypothetical protein